MLFSFFLIIRNLAEMISPLDIRQQTFNKASFGGYDKDEVRAFLYNLSLEWEKLQEENRQLKVNIAKLTQELSTLKEVEQALRDTLMQAKTTAQQTLENAEKQAILHIQEAKITAERIIARANEEEKKIQADLRKKIKEVEREYNEILSRRDDIIEQLRAFLAIQTERLKAFERNEKVRLDTFELSENEMPTLKIQEEPTQNKQAQPINSSLTDLDDILNQL
ncbi:MAG: DivIVA domain-containing protein [Bacteroidia bacterium]|nr:DivIVA domain-containing protein [Bacteroidia bacterium]